MFGITDLPAYLLGSIAIILLPGPNSLFCLAVSGQQGVRQGYQTLLGIMLGDTLLIVATVFGAGTLLRLYPAAFLAIKIAGGAYLAYLGVNLIRAGWQKWTTRRSSQPAIQSVDAPQIDHPISQTSDSGLPVSGLYNFKRALMLSITNPKAILFYLSFFIQFVDPLYPNPLLTFLILSIILQTLSFGYLNLLIFAGARLTRSFSERTALASLSMALVGCLFIGFAVKLWTATLN